MTLQRPRPSATTRAVVVAAHARSLCPLSASRPDSADLSTSRPGNSEMFEVLGSFLVVLATSVTVGTAVAPLLRPARLRREEALWRQTLESMVGAPAAAERVHLARDLHWHATAKLMSTPFAPPLLPTLTPLMLIIGMGLALLLGVGIVDVWVFPVARTAVASVLLTLEALMALFALHHALPQLASEMNARNVLTQHLLADKYPVTVFCGLDVAECVHTIPPLAAVCGSGHGRSVLPSH